MQRTRTFAVVLAVGLIVTACQSDTTSERAEEPRAGLGGMGIVPPSSGPTELMGPEFFPCHPGKGDASYTKYGVGRMRRGGLEREELEPDHIVIDGHGVNFHCRDRFVDGGTIEMEMDEDYFGPTVLKGPAGATVTIELALDTARRHQRRAQFLLDFIEAENSMGFHADQEAMRVLALSLDEARRGQVAVRERQPAAASSALRR